ncbi:hypothetical protein BCV72DRAFT_219019 [Rhizopus microsporus var. microsporus]|uniref:Uncharacterized protein n=2 Tax=Rhizopus microsporus TaxID=58291 RepID=A0A2G4SZK7_RHIZD|nr:uncharacterized protein RHIMIDRAFT_278351 [Rhizopus microsporus ATCC 52813]ORE12126.1 hypothetical protein BCV72DRAFT_219019 [Rhizopus microsporus var. microsporus]PHZ14184.1 hypothetical protein RHIMIDRAFT_278351 [Rhizopus microsporus ATCC 52813]
MAKFELENEATKNVFMRVDVPPYTNTIRLLQQYSKNRLHKPWYRCLCSYLKGFTPIILIDCENYIPQKNKAKTIHRSASRLLSILCGQCPSTKDMILDMWFLGTFTAIIKTKQQSPTNFR